MSEKSILEQALLQVETLEEAVKQNAKGILASTMKQELNDLLKESMEEEEPKEEDPEKEEDVPATEDEVKEQGEEEEEEPSDEEPAEDDLESEEGDEEEGDDLPSLDEPNKEIDSLDAMGDTMGEPAPETDEDVLDMTNASDDEVLKVFKAMGEEDGIVVKKDGDKIELEDGEDEYIIKLNEEEEEETPAEKEEKEFSEEISEDWNEEDETSEENVYEIELGEEEVSEEEDAKAEDEVKEVETTEAARTKWNPHGNKGGVKRAPLPKKVFKAGALNEEVENLRKQNAEYKKALVLFKDKLNEVAVFNANLAYATRLFTEHTTTKAEKMEILKRFDTISSITESKNLYNQIKTELDTKKPVTEAVVEKIAATPSSSSTEVLSENKVYEAPQFRRMKDLMTKIK